MDNLFKIGNFCFRLISSQEIELPVNFMKFNIENNENNTFTYELSVCTKFPASKGKLVANYEDLLVFVHDDLEQRYIGLKGIQGYYACYEELSHNYARVYIAQSYLQHMSIDTIFVSILALEKHLINKEGLILHCAYIEYQDKAILFSAPSQTGKTTQATLWEEYREGKTINGDRALLQKVDNQWYARGWPICGSSKVCMKKDLPIAAIIMLSQGLTNNIEKLDYMRAFSQIYTQITINNWNKERQLHSMDLIEQLINDITIYHLSCTISKEAVECLEEKLIVDKLL